MEPQKWIAERVHGTLFDVSQEMEEIERKVVEQGGELLPEDSERWESACNALVAKVDSFALYAKMLEGRAEKMLDVSKALKAKAASYERHYERLMVFADKCIPESGKLRGEAFELARVKNPGRVEIQDAAKVAEAVPEAVSRRPLEDLHEIVLDENGVPKVWLLKIDANAVKALIKRGGHVEGATLLSGTRVEVRP